MEPETDPNRPLQEFRISEENIWRYKKRLFFSLFIIVPITIIAVLIGSAMAYAENPAIDIDKGIPIMFAIVTPIFVISFFLYYKLMIGNAKSFRFSTNGDVFIIESKLYPKVSISRQEIISINTTKAGYIIISGNTGKRIVLPPTLGRMESLQEMLSGISYSPGTENTQMARRKAYYNAALAFWVIMFFTMALSTNKIMVTISGFFTAAGIIGWVIRRQYNYNISHKAKRRSWLMLLLLIFVFSAVGAHLSGMMDMQEGGNKEQTISSKQEMIINFDYPDTTYDSFYVLESELVEMLNKTDIGRYDGHSLEEDILEGRMYFYGPDAWAVYHKVENTLKKYPFMKGARVSFWQGADEDRVMIEDFIL